MLSSLGSCFIVRTNAVYNCGQIVTFRLISCVLYMVLWILDISLVSGKWFNYGIIFIVLILDLNMWKNQIFYSPFEYGQYTGPEYKV